MSGLLQVSPLLAIEPQLVNCPFTGPTCCTSLTLKHPAAPQTPPAHCAPLGQATPHLPQLPASLVRSVSQPLPACPSQSPKFMAHAPSEHTPLTQVATECAGAGQAMPQPPQLAGSFCASTQL